MRALVYSAAVTAAAVLALPVRADDDAKKIIQETVKACGGAEVLAKHHGKGVIQKGKLHASAGGMDLDGALDVSSQGGKFRRTVKLSIMGTDITQTTVFNGQTMWIDTNGMLTTVDDKDQIALIKESLYGEEALGQVMLGESGFKLSVIGDDKVGDTPVVGIRISKEGHKDVSVYFDKKTHLVKKIVSRGLDFQTQMEVESERIVEGYKEFDGQMRPIKVTVNQDGKKTAEIEVTGVEYVDKFDDDVFAKPK
jgi:hypothetical protein